MLGEWLTNDIPCIHLCECGVGKREYCKTLSRQDVIVEEACNRSADETTSASLEPTSLVPRDRGQDSGGKTLGLENLDAQGVSDKKLAGLSAVAMDIKGPHDFLDKSRRSQRENACWVRLYPKH